MQNFESLNDQQFRPMDDAEAKLVFGGAAEAFKFTYIGDTQNPDGTVVSDYLVD